ncbi:hypothetical protein HZU83_17135 [Sphaerotilus montanus]|jgi:hypothetical protein|uniref:Uncharacterized protein n=1 Tax=Sphaerotilus montanus TaxID=522889 RepID=A0A7Y9R2U7_9BURK|nr:hypothetical protein [Sphaerotilus montanus]NYG35284.1 hypothetical protein [Sphaerotilus montanus]NZD58414.1 hypothetical protein [Sphaerotilus montanus]
MFTLMTRLTVRELLLRQAPALLLSLLVAELFYKWHSFLLETGGFLLTWFVLDAAGAALARLSGRREQVRSGVS